MEFDTPNLSLILLSVTVGLAVILLKRAKWVGAMRAEMAQRDPEQFARMPSFGTMVLQIWVQNARGFGWVNREAYARPGNSDEVSSS